MKQIIKAKIFTKNTKIVDLTNGKDYHVISKGKDENVLNGCYYEVYDDKNILTKYDASWFENWEHDNFENTNHETESQNDDVSYCVNCNQIIEFVHDHKIKCINDGMIHNCVMMSRKKIEQFKKSEVHHPSHYGGASNVYEAIKIIEHYNLGFCLGNTLKYILRAGKKDETKLIEDLEKAKWYLERKINNLKQKQQTQ